MMERRLSAVAAPLLILLAAMLGGGTPAQAQAGHGLTAMQILERLRAGGYVLVMRHADSPFHAPSAREAEPDNPHLERQLDAAGKANAQAVGRALRTLHVPIGQIFSSPTYRALETVRLAQLGSPHVEPALAEGAHGMAGAAEAARTEWLRRAANRTPPRGRNTLIVTHTPNIVGAFGSAAARIEAGEMLVFEPMRGSPPQLIGRLSVADWKRLAQLR